MEHSSTPTTHVVASTPCPHKVQKTVEKTTKTHLTDTEFMFIVSWLEDKDNKDSIYGTDRATKIGIACESRTAGLKALADALNKQSKGRLSMDYKSMSGRLRTYRTNLRTALEMELETGFGVTEKDRRMNIFTVRQKLAKVCAHYERMKALFGEDPSLRPLLTMDSLDVDAANIKVLLSDKSSDSESEQIGNKHSMPLQHHASFSPSATAAEDDADRSANEEDEEEPLQYSEEVSPMLASRGMQAHDNEEDEEDPFQHSASLPTMVSKRKRASTTSVQAKDKRKAPPSLQSVSLKSRQTFAQVFQDLAATKGQAVAEAEAQRLDFERERLKLEQSRWEAKRKDKAAERLEGMTSQERNIKRNVMVAALSQDKTTTEIKELLSLLD